MPSTPLSPSPMDKNQKKTHQAKRKTTHFLRFLGFSGKKKSSKVVQSNSKKKKRWFSWFKRRMKKSGTKTIPLDSTTSEEKQRDTIHDSKLMRAVDKASFKRQTTIISHDKTPPHQTPVTGEITSDQAVRETPEETRYGSEQNIILENRKQLKAVDSPKNDTCQRQRLSFCRKIGTIRSGQSQPGSPETKRTILIPRSTSFPISILEQEAANLSVPKMHRKGKNEIGKNMDPVVGMSIITVTLVIMLVWGRLCAILCICAWFIMVPRVRTTISNGSIVENDGVSGEQSPEYKKKVVLEGFLERNHRSTVL